MPENRLRINITIGRFKYLLKGQDHLIPDITREYIQDKSKSDKLATSDLLAGRVFLHPVYLSSIPTTLGHFTGIECVRARLVCVGSFCYLVEQTTRYLRTNVDRWRGGDGYLCASLSPRHWQQPPRMRRRLHNQESA